METINKSRTTHNTQVQFLRGLFCVLLVLYHYTCRYSQIYLDYSYYVELLNIFGNAALGGFLIVSGYYFNNPDKEISPGSFVVSKLKRLYPEYLIAVVIIYVISLTGLLGPDRQLSFVDFLANIPMINVLIGVHYVDGAHWYVTFLLVMALFFYLLIFMKIDKRLSVWLISSSIWLIIILLLHWKYPSIYEKAKDYIRYYILFSTGVAYRIYHVKKKKVDHITFSSIVALNCISVILLIDYCYLLCILVTGVVIGMAVNKKLKLLEHIVPVIAIGDISYTVYLLHQNIGYCIINYFKQSLNSPEIINVTLALSIVLLISFIVTFIRGIGGKYGKKAS